MQTLVATNGTYIFSSSLWNMPSRFMMEVVGEKYILFIASMK